MIIMLISTAMLLAVLSSLIVRRYRNNLDFRATLIDQHIIFGIIGALGLPVTGTTLILSFIYIGWPTIVIFLVANAISIFTFKAFSYDQHIFFLPYINIFSVASAVVAWSLWITS